MVTTAGTSETEVRVEIDTGLSNSEVSDILDRVEREVNRAYSSGTSDFVDSQHRIDFEAALAALRIAEGRDRRAEEESRESASIAYETQEIDNLRQRVRRRDPKGEFGQPSTLARDTTRRSGTANPNSD